MIIVINNKSSNNSIETDITIARLIQYLVYKKKVDNANIQHNLNPINFGMFDCITNWDVKNMNDCTHRVSSILLGEPMDKFNDTTFTNSYLPPVLKKHKRNKKLITIEEYDGWNYKNKYKNVKAVKVSDFINETKEAVNKLHPALFCFMLLKGYKPSLNWIVIGVPDYNSLRTLEDTYNAFVLNIVDENEYKHGLVFHNELELFAAQLENYLTINDIVL